ncbi:MAG: AAA family ATPase [Chloroflexi bacterium]|nr:AAA family ATPase [Chloroflexota bacterium]
MILILTGPPAAGKSTIGPLLAKQLDRCAVIDVDVLRAMVVQPHIAPWRGEAGRQQLVLGARNACGLARAFAADGFHVVILDVLTDETARLYQTELATLAHQIVLLLPTLQTTLQRNRDRGQFLTDDEVGLLYEWQRALTLYDQQIDNSELSVEAVVDALQQAWR